MLALASTAQTSRKTYTSLPPLQVPPSTPYLDDHPQQETTQPTQHQGSHNTSSENQKQTIQKGVFPPPYDFIPYYFETTIITTAARAQGLRKGDRDHTSIGRPGLATNRMDSVIPNLDEFEEINLNDFPPAMMIETVTESPADNNDCDDSEPPLSDTTIFHDLDDIYTFYSHSDDSWTQPGDLISGPPPPYYSASPAMQPLKSRQAPPPPSRALTLLLTNRFMEQEHRFQHLPHSQHHDIEKGLDCYLPGKSRSPNYNYHPNLSLLLSKTFAAMRSSELSLSYKITKRFGPKTISFLERSWRAVRAPASIMLSTIVGLLIFVSVVLAIFGVGLFVGNVGGTALEFFSSASTSGDNGGGGGLCAANTDGGCEGLQGARLEIHTKV
ncbi:hypothetical protein B0H66DRAFT_622995 [Apodospora peruviana]|uniref:Uncharacterized protein n=1 Tax=Apodospora peruviana TaxID=516989 RepID=A0AAE0M4N4_9PEZI|nr:hypothetical protein B0H66DRAFT_622995 [Apodospora peruviana]